MSDCNVCQYLNITEKEQNEVYERTGRSQITFVQNTIKEFFICVH